MVPPGMLDELARFQMGAKVTVDFPDAWRTNLVEVVVERRPLLPDHRWDLDRLDAGLRSRFRLDAAMEEIHHRCAALAVPEQQWVAELSTLAADDVSQVIIEACLKHGVMPDELLAEITPGTFDYEGVA